MFAKRLKIGVLLLSTGLFGCPPEKPPRNSKSTNENDVSDSVAVINGETLSYDEFARRISSLTPYARARYSTVEARQEFLDTQIDFELLADYAEKQGYGDDPEVVHAMKQSMVRQYLQQELMQRVKRADIKEEELKDLYAKHESRYMRPAARRSVFLCFADQASGTTFVNQIAAADDPRAFLLKSLKDMNVGVRQPVRGDIGFLEDPTSNSSKNTGRNKLLATKVFGLKAAGEFLAPFELQDAWCTGTFVEKRTEQKIAFNEVRDDIREKLYLQRREEAQKAFIEELRADAKIEINKEALAKVPAPEAPSLQKMNKALGGANPVRDLKGPTGVSETPDKDTK